MLGGIALPGLETLAWMAGAALVGAGAVMLPGLGRRIKILRVAWLKARGENTAIEEWELDQYDPHALTEEQQRDLPLTVLGAAIYAAVSAWIWRELDQNVGEVLLAAGVAAVSLIALIGNLSKTDEELGLTAEPRDPMQGPPTFMERHGKKLNELGGAVAVMGVVALLAFRERLFGEDSVWPLLLVAVLVAGGFFAAIRRWMSDPESDITFPRESALGLLAAVGIVLLLLAVVLWLL